MLALGVLCGWPVRLSKDDAMLDATMAFGVAPLEAAEC